MISMPISNQEKTNKNKTPDLGSVFSLSLDQDSTVDPKQFLLKVESNIKEILSRRFPGDSYKQEIHPKHDRLNFACPYCGDSQTDSWKKRANVYEKGFNYHCFNCGEHTTYEKFLKDFDKNVDPKEMVYLREQHEKFATAGLSSGSLDPYIFLQVDHVEKWAVDRVELIKKMGCTEARGTKIETYLKKRMQMDMNRFAWNQQAQKLLIFNLTQDGKRVLGFQIRNFVAKPKYLTFKLDKIYEEIFQREIPQDETFEYANSISITFNILNIDINKPITVFEGPLDAFLFKNAVAVCSVKNEFPFDFPVRWMYDYDKAGKEASLKRINKGEPVFLWKKFLQESQTGINTVKKIDLTDIIVYSIRKRLTLPDFESYFSKTKYDVYWI
jgi:predicted RNA-binding Zn-ribbon protein involved in translation (DUF1610 family)